MCDCFNISSITFDDLNITNSFTLGGNFSCSAGSFIDPGCLIVGNCPNFAPCDLLASSLTLKDGGNPITYLTVGQPGIFTPNVLMGDSQALSPYRLNSIKMFAESTAVDGRTRVDIRATLGSVLISAAGSAGSVLTLGSTGTVLATSGSDMTFNAAGPFNAFGATAMRLFAATEWQARGSTVNITSNVIGLTKMTPFGTGNSWLETSPAQSYTISCMLPVTPNGNPSVRIREDLIMDAGRTIINTGASGFQAVGPYLDIPAGRLRASACGNLSIEASIYNSLGPVVIDDPDGLDVRGTPIVSTTGTVTIQNGTTFQSTEAEIHGTEFAYQSITTGVLDVSTINAVTISASTINGGAGTCCTSDARMKTVHGSLDRKAAADRVARLELKEFSYLPKLLKEDTWVRNGTHRGVIAQKIKKDFPDAVRVVERRVGTEVIKDFHMVRYDQMVPDLLGALQYALKEIAALKAELRNR